MVSKTLRELGLEAGQLAQSGAQLAEWRADFYSYTRPQDILEALEMLRLTLQEIPLLFTYRTRREGGEGELGVKQYKELLIFAMQSGCVDIVDVEYSAGEEAVSRLLQEGKRQEVTTILSSHNFTQTPPADDILDLLCKMNSTGAEIVKVAVMPGCAADVLELLQATESFHRLYPKGLLITMSMGAQGSISRVAGEFFGSCVSFASLKQASAPGQLAVEDLKTVLDILHMAMENKETP